VFMVIRKLATMQNTSRSFTSSESVPRMVSIPPT
jgi:hypothetical protein